MREADTKPKKNNTIEHYNKEIEEAEIRIKNVQSIEYEQVKSEISE
jgi:hypothetical protein